jgi:hypothetical protein
LISEYEKRLHIPSGSVSLGARLIVPVGTEKLVVFAHGSGNGRFSPRNNFVADVLAAHGFGVLLIDLLTTAENLSHKHRLDVDLLTLRLFSARDWIREHEFVHDFHIGLFGAGTGLAAALTGAAWLGSDIKAVWASAEGRISRERNLRWFSARRC